MKIFKSLFCEKTGDKALDNVMSNTRFGSIDEEIGLLILKGRMMDLSISSDDMYRLQFVEKDLNNIVILDQCLLLENTKVLDIDFGKDTFTVAVRYGKVNLDSHINNLFNGIRTLKSLKLDDRIMTFLKQFYESISSYEMIELISEYKVNLFDLLKLGRSNLYNKDGKLLNSVVYLDIDYDTKNHNNKIIESISNSSIEEFYNIIKEYNRELRIQDVIKLTNGVVSLIIN